MTDDLSRDAQVAAEQMLVDYWNVGGQPTIPVDSISIAKQMGIKVWVVKLDDGVAGMLVKQPSSEPEIYLSKVDDREHQRFTCAHELGHYVRHQEQDPGGSWANVDRREQLSGRGSDVNEHYANTFAACLLIPESRLNPLKGHILLNKLAIEFGVPTEAINYRLANLQPALPIE